MVEKVIARQRLGQYKSMVRNQSTMEARDGEKDAENYKKLMNSSFFEIRSSEGGMILILC